VKKDQFFPAVAPDVMPIEVSVTSDVLQGWESRSSLLRPSSLTAAARWRQLEQSGIGTKAADQGYLGRQSGNEFPGGVSAIGHQLNLPMGKPVAKELEHFANELVARTELVRA
jgi:hypothetical protein